MKASGREQVCWACKRVQGAGCPGDKLCEMSVVPNSHLNRFSFEKSLLLIFCFRSLYKAKGSSEPDCQCRPFWFFPGVVMQTFHVISEPSALHESLAASLSSPTATGLLRRAGRSGEHPSIVPWDAGRSSPGKLDELRSLTPRESPDPLPSQSRLVNSHSFFLLTNPQIPIL